MRTNFDGDDLILLNRYIESVLLRFGDGRYSLLDATQELTQAFTGLARNQPDLLEHMLGVVEAGDDA
jgi:hypothetical protein